MRILLVLILLVTLCASFIPMAYAKTPGDKLTRGIANALSGGLEVPKNIDEEWKASKNAAVGIFAGLFKGICWGMARTFSGLWDVLTFPFPLPKDYDSVVLPEYLWSTEHTHLINQ